ncbi:MAG: porin [Lentimonas sp.]
MKLPKKLFTVLALSGATLLSIISAQTASTTMPSAEEMWRIIQAQQAQIDALTKMVQSNQQEVTSARSEVASAKATASSAQAAASSTRKELASTQAQLEATTLAVEEGGSVFGGSGWWEKTSVGGYGELHANFYENADNQVDFHRFVLFFNHEYNDWITLYTEFELEHSLAGDAKPGEVELEQAFVRMDWTEDFSTDTGIFLMPVGILNEIHEPNTFYGIERNNVESRIIPSTWWEAGLKGNYRFGNGIALDGGITSGLDISDSGVIHDARQKVAKAVNNEAAFVGRVKYTGIAGLEVAASVFYQDDMAQTADADISGLLSEAHADYTYEGFRIRALYARWDLDGATDSDAETQYGFYIEPSYRWTFSERYGDFGVYFRYSDYEYYTGSALSENEIYEIGINWWPTPNVVFKADIQDISEADQYNSKGDSVFNLGFGYQF